MARGEYIASIGIIFGFRLHFSIMTFDMIRQNKHHENGMGIELNSIDEKWRHDSDKKKDYYSAVFMG